MQGTLFNNEDKKCPYCGRKATKRIIDSFGGYIHVCNLCFEKIAKKRFKQFNNLKKTMTNEKEEVMKDKAEFYLAEKIKVHINKTNKTFLNGYFVEKKNDSVFIFKDNKLGLIHLFLAEIYDIEEYQEEV